MKSKNKEKLFLYLYGDWYKGNLPNFMPIEGSVTQKILENNYEKIKDEFIRNLNFIESESSPMYVPNSYENLNWNVLNFYGYTIKNSQNIKKYPILNSVLLQIPGMIGAQYSVLEPHTRVKAHFAATSGTFRFHLPIVVPASYPDIGIRVRNEERGWEEGKVIAISEAIRHYTWNNTDEKRVLLLVDVVRPEYINRKNFICAASLTLLVMRFFTYKYPKTRRLPRWVVTIIFLFFVTPVRFVLLIQSMFGIDISSVLAIKKVMKKNNT